MPLKKARGKSQKSIQKAVGINIAALYNDNKTKPPSERRKPDQIKAIAFSVAKGGGKNFFQCSSQSVVFGEQIALNFTAALKYFVCVCWSCLCFTLGHGYQIRNHYINLINAGHFILSNSHALFSLRASINVNQGNTSAAARSFDLASR